MKKLHISQQTCVVSIQLEISFREYLYRARNRFGVASKGMEPAPKEGAAEAEDSTPDLPSLVVTSLGSCLPRENISVLMRYLYLRHD